jgi:drug/metabolite transporter (DMT)-like permease
MNRLALTLLWMAFFACSVHGHLALKLAVDRRQGLLAAATTWWGLSAFAAWSLSGVLWMAVLAAQPLMRASSLSALRYLLVCAAAWLFLGERVAGREAIGAGLIAVGVVLVAGG